MDLASKKRKLLIVVSILIILTMSLGIFIGSIQQEKTQAVVISNADVISTGLLLKTRDTSVGGNVFNAVALQELYAKLAGTNATFADVEDNARAQKSTYANDSVKSIHSGMDSEDIRTSNGNNIIVKIDGKEWIVTALTTTDNSNSSHVVLTLMLKDVAYASNWAEWCPNSATDFSATYPASMYSTSYVRAGLLNGSVPYTSDGSNLVSLTDAEKADLYAGTGGYPFSIFTDTNGTGNITDFLVPPNKVLYQQYENLYDIEHHINTTWYAAPNDSSKNNIDSSKWHICGMEVIQQNGKYFDWGNDLIWLPSLSETGQNNRGTIINASGGLWNLDSNQRSVSNNNLSWLRSALYHNAMNAYSLDSAGGYCSMYVNATEVIGDDNVHGGNLAVRPALNLDLTLAEQSSAYIFDVPGDFSVEYNGNPQGVEEQSWYTTSFASIVDVDFYDKTSQSPISKPTVVGDYMVKLTIKGNNVWSDNKAGSERFINFSITQKRIDFPTFLDGSEKPYNGGGLSIDGKVEFQVEYRDEYLQYVTISKPSGAQYNNVTFNSNSYKVTAYDVGKYQLDVTLNDPVNTKWKTSNNKLEFEVTKAQINLSITDPSQNNELTGAVGEQLTVYIDIDQSTIIHDGNTLTIKITASSQGVPTLPISADITLDENDRQVPVTLDLSDLMGNKQYTINVSTESGNYDPQVISSTTLDVSPAPTRTVLTWNLYSDGLLVRGQYKDADISQSETDVILPNNLTYNGKRYTFKVSVPTGYKVDTTYGVGGFLVIPSTSGNNNVGINADTYTTKIRLIENASGDKQEYSITWTIEPAKFDLSTVKWLYDGQLPYDRINGSEAILDPKTLPAGLIPTYGNNTGTTVGTSGSASVTFTLDPAYVGNYIEPDENAPTTYVDPNSDFEWSKTWNIVKAEIQASSWKNETYTDTNGKAFDVPVLRDPNADGGVVTYEYYECDSLGNITNNTPLTADDIIWSESEAKFYIAKPILQDTLNYSLDDPSAQSKVFRVGKELTKVQVSLEKSSMEYNTNPRHAVVKVANGALPTTAFDLTYYDGYTRLTTAPTEVGNYRVEVSLKNTYIDKYQIDGDYEFDYEITKAKIAVDWNDNIKPPTLKLTYGQINGVEYEIIDSEDNVVSYNDLVAGKTYRIRAKIKSDQLNNFIFADDTVETDWREFSVSANDQLYDPNSPTNPSYPQTDPDLPSNSGDENTPSGNVTGSGNEGGGTLDELLAKLKEIPLWQIIAIIISIILIIIFLSKTAGYESKRKKYKKKADKLETTVYAGAFLGLAFTAWTAIACVCMALAVASFVIMLIAKSRFNKAEENYEDCLEEYQNNKADVEDKKREEDARKRDESMQMMLMSMMGGNAGGNMGQGMPQGGFAYAQPGISVEEMRGLISETVTAMLPGMQQMLPQQASGGNDELVQKLLEKTEKNEETMQKLMKKIADQSSEKVIAKEIAVANANDETIRSIIDGQRAIMQRLAEQPVERVVERENNDETIKQMMKTQEDLMRNQEKLMEKILELSAAQPQPQIVEKVVEVPVEVEKIVEKEVPVEVEKIVEKEVVKEVPVEKIVEVPVEKVVEKVVEKEVKVEVTAPAKAPKERAPRLTLDEAYARLSKQQKKYFDELRAYALTKDKCKEKKSTYFILLGQSSVNPLVKLTIKKDTTVALFKMEDEYLKDIKRDAGNEGTKMRVKETELIVADAQAFATAKRMVNLREDQIDRYQEYMKEQRAMKNKK